MELGLYLDAAVLERLDRRCPLSALDETNLGDYCTALEGVSHFHYVTWSAGCDRRVSLLELELQAEVDKYASALSLLLAQRDGRFPGELFQRLFEGCRLLPHLTDAERQRYMEADRRACRRFCERLENRFLRRRQARPAALLAELRSFYRLGEPRQAAACTAVRVSRAGRATRRNCLSHRPCVWPRSRSRARAGSSSSCVRSCRAPRFVGVVALLEAFCVVFQRVQRLVLDDAQVGIDQHPQSLDVVLAVSLPVRLQRVVLRPLPGHVAAVVHGDTTGRPRLGAGWLSRRSDRRLGRGFRERRSVAVPHDGK